jgi:ATP-binding cassette subfamily B protein
MNKLIKYLKPYTLMVLAIVGLLFLQAMTDLALPDYMSRIVNVGLQQNGIESTVPNQLRTNQLDRLLILMPDEQSSRVDRLFVRDGQSGVAVLGPSRLNQLTPVERDDLEQQLGRSILLLSALDDDSNKIATGLPSGDAFWPELAGLPAEARQDQLARVARTLNDLSQTTILQSASIWIAQEYQATGLDVTVIQSRAILGTGTRMLLIALVGVALAVCVGFLSSRLAAGLGRDLRSQIFRRVESFSSTEFDHFSTASLITRTSNDIQQIQNTFVFLIRTLFFAPMMAIGGLLKIIGSDASMIWVIVLAIVALLTLIGAIFAVTMPRFKRIQQLIDRLNLITREILTGLMVTRAFNTQARMQDKFAQANQNLTKINLFVTRTMVLMMPMMMLIMNLTSIAVVWVGGQRVDAGTMQVGDMMAFLQYATTIIFSFLMVSMVFIMMPRASVSAQRVTEVIDTPLSIQDISQPKSLPETVMGEITFQNVTFRYPGAEDPVLCGISFTARPGQTTAIIGSTGSGKSTLVNLIPRFYDVTEGQILLDGVDIRELPQQALRQVIGYVPQKGILFTGDIAGNIAYGRPGASTDELRQAAQTAQVLDYIDSTVEGLSTVIAQGGTNVSGGQKQRLSIARALARQAAIYLFDDSFSALDYRTDAALRRALKEQTARSTVLIVAQRIATIRHAEQIIVLDQGRIVGAGRHRELLETCPVYAEIAASQLTAEELAG